MKKDESWEGNGDLLNASAEVSWFVFMLVSSLSGHVLFNKRTEGMNNVSLDPSHQFLPSIPFLYHIRSRLHCTAGESTAFHQLMQLRRELMRVKIGALACQLVG